jgi:uncharacterized protein YcfL
MKKTIASTLVLLLVSGCASLPSYQEMSCKDLIKKEKSLQVDHTINSIGSIAADIANIAEDTTESTVDVIVSEMDLQNTKRDLRIVQSQINKRRCKK